MNILFLTMLDFYSLENSNIYTDLMKEFIINGHNVYIVSPSERKNKIKTHLITSPKLVIVKQKIGNIQKTNYLEKGLSTLFLEKHYKTAVKKHYRDVKFDKVVYSTPPISFTKAIKFIIKRDGAMSYLLLKDIFPQNAVDIGIIKKTGWQGMVYRYFKRKEKELYRISDNIGCMSEANKHYIINNNHQINPQKIEVNPNSIAPIVFNRALYDRKTILRKHNIDSEKVIFIYGGNLGRPQGIDFLSKCILENENNSKAFFVIVGNGTEYNKIEKHIKSKNVSNSLLIPYMDKASFDELLCVSDVGMVFLDYRFTIPNYPSRILSYMQASLPILAATDEATDLKENIKLWGNGVWTPSNNVASFKDKVEKLCDKKTREIYSVNSGIILKEWYNVNKSFDMIVSKRSKGETYV